MYGLRKLANKEFFQAVEAKRETAGLKRQLTEIQLNKLHYRLASIALTGTQVAVMSTSQGESVEGHTYPSYVPSPPRSSKAG